MNSVPRVQTSDRNINQLQSNIIPPLNTALNNQLLNGLLLQNVALASGANSVNTTLGRNLIGWLVTRWHGSYQNIYDTQDTNKTPSQTLQLVAAGAVTVDLWVF